MLLQILTRRMRNTASTIAKILFRMAGVLIAAFIFGVVVTEAGAWLRHKMFSQVLKERGSDNQIILVGDSVMGPQDSKYSISHHFISSLKKQVSSDVTIINNVSGALVLPMALEKLKGTIAEKSPTIVIMMLGKSDHDAKIFGSLRLPAWLSELHMTRILKLVLHSFDFQLQEIRFRFDSANNGADFRQAWRLYADGQFAAAIPLFEAELFKSPNYTRPLRPLYHCYYETQQFTNGARYFKSLEPLSKNGRIIRFYAANLEFERDQIASNNKYAVPPPIVEQLEATKGDREAFKLLLRMLQNLRQNAEFASLLSSMTENESYPFPQSEIGTLKHIVQACADARASLVLLQYPTDNAQSLRNILEPLSPSVSIVDTREWLLALPQRDRLIDLVDKDIDHVTSDGAKIIGERLADLIVSMLVTKSYEGNTNETRQDSRQVEQKL